MIIKYPAGRMVEGFLLTRNENSMRVALKDVMDAVEFIDVQGNWVSENLEPVEITFEWQRQSRAPAAPAEDDFICSQDLAARLIRLLGTDSDEEETPRPRYLTAGSSIM